MAYTRGDSSSMKRRFMIGLCVSVALGLFTLGMVVNGQGEYNYQATIVALRTEDGTPTTQFSRGQFVFVDVKLENIMGYTSVPEPYLLVARATYDLTLYGLAAFSGSMISGQEMNVMPAFVVPSDAPFMSYEIKVMVFSTWPSAGGFPIAVPVTTTFTVVAA
jgi:hypothetical protein